jgi:hypothetical protein
MDRPPFEPVLTQVEIIDLLEFLKTKPSTGAITDKFGLPERTARRYKSKYSNNLDYHIKKLRLELSGELWDYKQQEICEPDKISFKCHSCGFVASENNIPEIMEHLNRKLLSNSILFEKKL